MKKLVIIPTYNESENVEAMIECVMLLAGNFHALFIDDNSPDGTADIIRSRQKEFPDRVFLIERSGKLGLGTAYLAGFSWALERDFDVVFEMDCDFSHNPDDLIRLTESIEQGADVVVGSRYSQGVNVINWPMSRLLMSWCASKYVQLITGMPIKDATAGFVGYRRKALQTIPLDSIRMKGYGFQIEMKYTAWKLGLITKEVSIIFTERTRGTSKMSSSIFGEAFWGVIRLRLKRFKK